MQTCASCGAPLRPRSRFCTACGAVARARRFPWKWVAAGALLAAAPILVVASREPPAPSPTGATPAQSPARLVERVFPDLGYAVGYPAGWRSSRKTIEEGRVAALFRDPAAGTRDNPERAFDVISENLSLADARARVEADLRSRFPAYAKVGITDGLQAAGRAAFRHDFFVEQLRYEQWWIARDGGTLRVTFWALRDRASQGAELNARILETLRFL